MLKSDCQPDSHQLPCPCVLLLPGGEKAENAWTVTTVCATHTDWTPLLRGLLGEAIRQHISEIEGMLPDEHMLYNATVAAGIQPHTDDQTHFVYELKL